jgi:hypothetical protein
MLRHFDAAAVARPSLFDQHSQAFKAAPTA